MTGDSQTGNDLVLEETSSEVAIVGVFTRMLLLVEGYCHSSFASRSLMRVAGNSKASPMILYITFHLLAD
jgi:hypothetical protein